MTRKDYQLIADCINKACESYNKKEGISPETKFDYVHGIVSLRNRLASELIADHIYNYKYGKRKAFIIAENFDINTEFLKLYDWSSHKD